MSDDKLNTLAEQLEQRLMAFYQSPILTGKDLQKAMGYRSLDALRQAISRKKFPIRIFSLPNRRGKYALVKDVASYLAKHSSSIRVENDMI